MVRICKYFVIKKRLVVQAFKNQTDNEWANKEALYGQFAYAYQWTPEQVDRIPYDRLSYLMETFKEIKMKENQK